MPDLDRIVFGTAALGLPYGLGKAGAPPVLMEAEKATALIERALAEGIRTFDTAPAYGEAEARLGRALRGRGVVWTKVGRAQDIDATLSAHLDRELDASLRRLERPRVEAVQWHNWTADLASNEHFCAAWKALGASGRAARLGASTYGPDDAFAAVTSGLFELVQVEWNVLNQRVLRRVGDEAARRGVAIAMRSVFLQGALTDDARTLPPIPRLHEGVRAARAVADRCGATSTTLALRAALDAPRAGYVLVGLDSLEQPADIRRIVEHAPLDEAQLRAVAGLDLDGDPATDPRTWR